MATAPAVPQQSVAHAYLSTNAVTSPVTVVGALSGQSNSQIMSQVALAGGVSMPLSSSAQGPPGTIAVVNHIPVVQAFAADASWSQTSNTSLLHHIPVGSGLKRRASGDQDSSPVGMNPLGQTQRRKESHNATEQKRRQRINDKMNELKELLPGCREAPVDKATILNEAIDLIRKLQSDTEALTLRKVELERQNQELQEENDHLSREAGLPPKKQSIQESLSR
uniref:BHLH domain-containing protein n=1 Tax=Hanusia phi TaxID=3032 RepID=A0A7S0EHV4_9CRYP|mmetsp:Transcript_24872/g.56143  ORF Transcript_24872/g.56143 Transcript_24872/m.56143 type:complete len:223 (+) Transcript_24872:81-749(+)